MSSRLNPSRRAHRAGGQADVATIIVLALLCAIVFAGCFLLGRASSPRQGGSPAAPSGVAAVAAGADDAPLRIGTAPAIATAVISRPKPKAKPKANPQGSSAVRTIVAPAAAVVVSAPQSRAPATGGSPKPHKHAPATSFDTSG